LILIAIKKTHAKVALVADPGAGISKIPNKNRQSSSDAPDKIVQETTFRCTSPNTNNCCNIFVIGIKLRQRQPQQMKEYKGEYCILTRYL